MFHSIRAGLVECFFPPFCIRVLKHMAQVARVIIKNPESFQAPHNLFPPPPMTILDAPLLVKAT